MNFSYMMKNDLKDFFQKIPLSFTMVLTKLRLFINGMEKEEVKSKFVSVSEEWKK